MKHYPNKLLILFPMWTAVDYRHRLDAIDDALVVHRTPAGEWQLELRPTTKLTARGAGGYAAALQLLAADLQAGYTVVIVERDRLLADLEALAREHATPKDQDAVERAAQVVAERTRFQVRDHLESNDTEHRIGRMLIAARSRRTKADRNEADGLNCQNGIPSPRSEQLWRVIFNELCSRRDDQAGRAAWERWCRLNRPHLPQLER